MIELDMGEVPEFHRRVYAIARTIPPGSSQVLGQNPFPIVVPCHRVVVAGGKLGGFSARGGLTTKRRILQATDA